MHIKDQTAEEMYIAWELYTGDKEDILSALAEAFMLGASAGGVDSNLFDEALNIYSENDK